MSWIFGYFGNVERFKINSPETPIHSFQSSNLLLYAGENKQTVFHKADNLNSNCWVAVGVGIKQSDRCYKNLDVNDWNNYLSPDEINLSAVNGHYVALKYSNNELKIFTDELGLREILLVKLPGGWGFTTRIDWLKYFLDPEFDLKEFGARWLLQNQISRNSIIKNVKRIVSANAFIKSNILRVEENPWLHDFEVKGGGKKIESTLKRLLSFEEKKISLSLSGGLDSRLLLSFLINKNSELWETHTFGDPNHPDSKIACHLMKSINLENKVINDVIPTGKNAEELLKNYAVKSVVTNPVSSILNLRFYDRISDVDKIIIDGGFGEIWRREFANRLLYLGKKALLDRNVERIFELLRHQKANFFNNETINEMKTIALNQIADFMQVSNDVRNIKIDRWVDLFSIKTRLPNYYAPEQTRVDDFVTSFMPFIQKDILKILFSFTVKERNNGKLFKDFIRRNAIALTKFPLVKGNITYSFGASSLSARFYSKLKMKTGLSYKDQRVNELFSPLKDFILDLLHSSQVRNCELYGRRKIERLVNGFSSNTTEFNNEIDWFLSFELFRQGITK